MLGDNGPHRWQIDHLLADGLRVVAREGRPAPGAVLRLVVLEVIALVGGDQRPLSLGMPRLSTALPSRRAAWSLRRFLVRSVGGGRLRGVARIAAEPPLQLGDPLRELLIALRELFDLPDEYHDEGPRLVIHPVPHGLGNRRRSLQGVLAHAHSMTTLPRPAKTNPVNGYENSDPPMSAKH